MNKITVSQVEYTVVETKQLVEIVYFEPTIENLQQFLADNQEIQGDIQILEQWEQTVSPIDLDYQVFTDPAFEEEYVIEEVIDSEAQYEESLETHHITETGDSELLEHS
jgi:hypothetical protein